MKKKVLSMVLVFTMILMQIRVVSAEEIIKDYEGHWASETIEVWMGQGLISGFEDGSFKPNETVTRAQFVTMVDNVFGFQVKGSAVYTDLKSADWYYDAVLKASAAGVVQGSNGMFRPNDLITRQEAAVALYNAYIMAASQNDVTKDFDDAGVIAAWAKKQINTLVANDYMRGRTNTTIVPDGYLTRAEALTLLANISGAVITKAGTVTKEFDGNVVINTKDVVLEDTIIEGNLYIGPGVAEGDVTLNNVTVKGKLIVLGGGVNSIILKNTSVNGLLVRKVGGKVRIVVIGSTEVQNTVLESGAILEEDKVTGEGFGTVEIRIIQPGELVTLDGNFDKVTLETAGVSIEIVDGTVGILNIEEKAVGTKVNVSSIATIKKVNVKAETAFEGKGIIEEAYVKSDGVSFVKEPRKLEAIEGVEVEIEEPKKIPGGGGGGGGGIDTPAEPAKVTLTIKVEIDGLGTNYINITEPSGSGTDVIFAKLVTVAKDLFDSNSERLGRLENLKVDGLTGEDTMFASALKDGTNKEKISKVLDVMDGKKLDDIREDLEKMARDRSFADVKYNSQSISEITLSGKEILNPSELVAKVFEILDSLTMTSKEQPYKITITLTDGSIKEATVTVSPK